MKYLVLILCLFFSASLFGMSQASHLYNLSLEKTPDGLEELRSFLSLPNDALYPEDIEKNISWLSEAFQKRGFRTQVLPTSNTPLFFAERFFSSKNKTVLFYMHFDGQGVDPKKWFQDNPYKAVLKEKTPDGYKQIDWERIKKDPDPEWRIFGRSSSDDKGPIIMFLAAMDLLNEYFGGESKINIKVILDGEEEKGSAQLPPAVEKYKDLLQADYMIINDGPIHNSDQPTVVFGTRGITRIDLTVYGPRTQQHSGHYGNYAPNPVFRMAHLLASMKDQDGRVIIPGYYDGIRLNAATQKIMQAVPDKAEKIDSIIGVAEPEKVGAYYQEALQYPSLNVRGFQSAWVGSQVRTIVPEKAVASIDIRLVPESDPDRLVGLVREHISGQGYYLIDREPTEKERLSQPRIVKFETGKATLPFRTNMNSPIGKWLDRALLSGMGKDVVMIRIMGGTVPIAPFINALEVPAVIIPLVNNDNNQHAPNENLRIWNFTNGVQVFLSILTQE